MLPRTSRLRTALDKVIRVRKWRFETLSERLPWFHYETQERRYLLREFGCARLKNERYQPKASQLQPFDCPCVDEFTARKFAGPDGCAPMDP
jgi:hypothetical protein